MEICENYCIYLKDKVYNFNLLFNLVLISINIMTLTCLVTFFLNKDK